MRLLHSFLTLSVLALVSAACTAESTDEDIEESQDEIRVSSSFVSKGTGYYPANNSMEGGFLDRRGKRLRTLQQFLAGQAEYVSVAMDTNAFSYGQRLRIKEFEQKYGRPIVFRVVDTGGAFRGKGRTRIDICTANRAASLDRTVNSTLHIDVIDERSGPPELPSNPPATSNPPTASEPVDTEPSGAKCSSDGACNPGNDGSGLVCQEGRCVPGCRTNAQCPGVKTCKLGQCS